MIRTKIKDSIAEYPIINTYKTPDPTKFKKGQIYVIGFNFKPLDTYFPDLRFLKKYFKVGKTTNLKARKQNLQTGAPFPTQIVHLIDCIDINSAEFWLHNELAAYRTCGEWFEISDEDMVLIKTVQKLIPKL